LRRTDSASRRSSPIPAKSTPKPPASPKKASTLAPSSESPKKVAPKTEKPPPVNIKPTIIENNSTLIRSLPDGNFQFLKNRDLIISSRMSTSTYLQPDTSLHDHIGIEYYNCCAK